MTTDEMCQEVIRRNLVVVDTQSGTAIATRFWNKPLGSTNHQGYKVCTLHLDGIRKQVKIHRLIWIAAHGIPPAGYVPDHINGIRSDNRLMNLRLVDAQGNSQNRRSYKGDGNPAAKITQSVADEIRVMYQSRRSLSKVARSFSVSKSLVAQIIRGERWAS